MKEKTWRCEGKDACNQIIVKHQVEHCGASEEQLEQYFKGKIRSPMQSTLVQPSLKFRISYKNEKLITFITWLFL